MGEESELPDSMYKTAVACLLPNTFFEAAFGLLPTRCDTVLTHMPPPVDLQQELSFLPVCYHKPTLLILSEKAAGVRNNSSLKTVQNPLKGSRTLSIPGICLKHCLIGDAVYSSSVLRRSR